MWANPMDAIKRLAKDYLSKCNACDECFCEMYCICNGLKRSREPYDGCERNIIDKLAEMFLNEVN